MWKPAEKMRKRTEKMMEWGRIKKETSINNVETGRKYEEMGRKNVETGRKNVETGRKCVNRPIIKWKRTEKIEETDLNK